VVGRIETPAQIYARAAASPATATLANLTLPGGVTIPTPGPTVDLSNPLNPKVGGKSATDQAKDAAGAVGGAITDPAGAVEDLTKSAVGDFAGNLLGPVAEVVLMAVLAAGGVGLIVYAVIQFSNKSGATDKVNQAAATAAGAVATGGASIPATAAAGATK
jgi:hypothetical protein